MSRGAQAEVTGMQMQVVAIVIDKAEKSRAWIRREAAPTLDSTASADALDTDTGGVSTGKVTHCRSVQEHPIGPGY